MNVVIGRAEPRELCAVLCGLGAVLRGLGVLLTLLTKANVPSEGVAEHWRLT